MIQSNFNVTLERVVDVAQLQIPTLKFLTHPAPQVQPLGHDPGNRVKILFNMFSILIGIRPQLFPLIGCIENGYNSTQDSSLFNGL